MQRVSLMFEDGERRELCHDGTGGLFDGGFHVGTAKDLSDIAAGGTGEVFEWGTFTVTAVTGCRERCGAWCPAA